MHGRNLSRLQPDCIVDTAVAVGPIRRLRNK
jgi:hypothetical protein